MFGPSEDLVPTNLGDPGGRFLRFREVDRGKWTTQMGRLQPFAGSSTNDRIGWRAAVPVV